MEPTDIVHFDRNLGALIQQTKVTTKLLAGLKSNKTLSEEEEQNLTAIKTNHGDIVAAKELYCILKTRKTGYNTLRKWLLIDSQQSVYRILSSGNTAIKAPMSGTLEQALAQELLKFPVKILGHVKSLTNTFPKLTLLDAEELLRSTKVMSEFQDLLANESSQVCLHGVIPPKSPLYINRSISDSVRIKSEVFGVASNDVFVFHTRCTEEVKATVQMFNSQSSESQLDDKVVASRYIHMVHGDDWDDLVSICNVPMHLMRMEGNDYIYLRSSQYSPILSKYIDASNNGYVSETELIKRLVADNESQGICICDVPGMGKTWLLQNLAREFIQIGSGSSVYYSTLPDFNRYLADKGANDDTLLTLLEFVCSSNMESYLVHKCVTKFSHKLFIFLDGFDELQQADAENMMVFLKNLLANSYKIRLCITSRPNMRNQLEETFCVIAHNILPFTTQDQILALVSQWKSEYPGHEISRMEELASVIIKNCAKLRDARDSDILGVPLKCYMLAKIETKQAKRCSDPTRTTTLKISEVATVITVCELYDKYITNGLTNLTKRLDASKAEEKKKELVNFHTALAVTLLFPEYLKYPEVKPCWLKTSDIVYQEAVSIGVLIYSNETKTYNFLHRTFAEYFVAKLIVDHLITLENKSEVNCNDVEFLLFTKVLRPTSVCYNAENKRFDLMYLTMREGYFKHLTLVRFINGLIQYANMPLYINELAGIFFKSLLPQDWYEVMSATDLSFPLSLCFQSTGLKAPTKLFFSSDIDFNMMMECCLSLGFNAIFTLLAKIINSLPVQEKLVFSLCSKTLMMKKRYARDLVLSMRLSDCNATRFLCKATENGNRFAMEELYKLFETTDGNLINPNYRFSSIDSPLITALKACNLETFCFFLDKIATDNNQILDAAVTNVSLKDANRRCRNLTSDEVGKRVNILEHFLSKRVNEISKLKSYIYLKLPSTSNIPVLKFLSTSYDFCWKETRIFQKVEILEHVLFEGNDLEFIQVLQIFFTSCKLDKKIDSSGNEKNSSYVPNSDASCVLLDQIDKREARTAISLLRFSDKFSYFKHLKEIWTLKMLMELATDYTETNKTNRGLMHYSVWNGNIDWVQSLLQFGYDMNQADVNGETPLFYIGSPMIVPITKVLLDNGAYLKATNAKNQNVAHLLAASVRKPSWEQTQNKITPADFHEWSMLTIQRGFKSVWLMRDSDGNTPLHLVDPDTETAQKIVNALLGDD